MPTAKKPRFEIVVGSSTRGPEFAAREAERQAKKAGGEQISIASSVVAGTSAATTQSAEFLDNIARNIYELVQCTCPRVIGKEIHYPGTPPPKTTLAATGGAAAGPLWVVYILLRH